MTVPEGMLVNDVPLIKAVTGLFISLNNTLFYEYTVPGEPTLTNTTFIKSFSVDSTKTIVTVSLDSDWQANFTCKLVTPGVEKTKEIVFDAAIPTIAPQTPAPLTPAPPTPTPPTPAPSTPAPATQAPTTPTPSTQAPTTPTPTTQAPTTPTPSTSDTCDSTRYCCCGKQAGKICIKNSDNGKLLKGNCEKDGNALYDCETSDYPAQLLKICSGLKGCKSIVPGHFGTDFCAD